MKRFHIRLLVFLALIVLIAAGWLPLKHYLQQLIQTKLVEYINTSPDRLYDYELGAVEIDILGGNTTLTNIRITPREDAIADLEAARIPLLIWAKVDSIALRGLALYKLFSKDEIQIRRILVGEVDFRYTINSAYQRPDSIVSKPFVLKHVFSEKLTKAYVKRAELRNISVIMDDRQTPEDFVTRFDSASVTIKEIYTDEEVMQGTQPFTYESLEMSAKRFVSIKVKGHTAKVESFTMNTVEKEIHLKGASFGPTSFDYKNPAKQFERSVNDISADEVKLSGINFDSWHTDEWVEIRHVQVLRPKVQVSMDHRWEKPMFERPLLQSRVRSIPFPIRIDTITASGGEVFYREIFSDGKPPLILTFSKVNAELFNITNQPALIEKDPILHMKATAEFLHEGKLTVKTDFRLNDTMNPLHLTLSLHNMSLATLNPILEGQVHARLDGDLNILALNVQANRKGAYGDFVFDYSGLKVTLFKEKETRHGIKEKKHWLLNTIVNPVLRTNNHVDQANFKGGNVAYVRPPDVSFFGMIWQCIKEGMITTMLPGKHDKTANQDKKKNKAKKK